MAAPGEFEEIMTRVVNKDGEIHVLMRDGNLRGDAGSRLANTIRKIIRQLGARLATFTLNGKTLVDENRNRPASKSDAPGSHERELDIFY
ncbi:hypothetical protein MK489_18340 [Myxococcota bacterium]|nr:hypothetical protein [Myxococcota bacterium]